MIFYQSSKPLINTAHRFVCFFLFLAQFNCVEKRELALISSTIVNKIYISMVTKKKKKKRKRKRKKMQTKKFLKKKVCAIHNNAISIVIQIYFLGDFVLAFKTTDEHPIALNVLSIGPFTDNGIAKSSALL